MFYNLFNGTTDPILSKNKIEIKVCQCCFILEILQENPMLKIKENSSHWSSQKEVTNQCFILVRYLELSAFTFVNRKNTEGQWPTTTTMCYHNLSLSVSISILKAVCTSLV